MVVGIGGVLGGIGGLAVAGGILATAVANILNINRENRAKAGKDSQKEQEEQDPNEVVGYILQLNSDKVMLTSGQPASVNATVWQVTANGATAQASDAAIQVDVPGAPPASCGSRPPAARGRSPAPFPRPANRARTKCW